MDFSVLKTVAHEHRYIIDAINKQSKLPKHYWRIALCRFFFMVDNTAELPSILRTNFCPLFWFTNFLLLTAPIWLTFALIGWVLIKIAGVFARKLIHPVEHKYKVYMAAKSQARCYKYYAAHAAAEKARRTFNPNEVNLEKLTSGKRSTPRIIKMCKLRGEHIPYKIDWADPKLIDLLYDDTAAYFASFLAMYGPAWRQELRKLQTMEREKYNRLTARYEAEAAKIKADRVKRDKMFTTIFMRAKAFCRVVALIVMLPVAIFAAIGLYHIAIFLVLALGAFCYFAFVEHAEITWTIVIMVPFVVPLLYSVGLRFAGDTCRDKIWRPMADRLLSFFDVYFIPFLCFISKPFIRVGGWFIKSCAFCRDFTKMFFIENCPLIEWEEEKKSESTKA